MDVTLSFAFFYLALISTSLSLNVGAAAEKQLGSEALSILLLDSADSSYNSSSRILREWVADTLRTASESASYQLQLISIDTQV